MKLASLWEIPKYGVILLVSMMSRGCQYQVPDTLLSMLEHEMDFFNFRFKCQVTRLRQFKNGENFVY